MEHSGPPSVFGALLPSPVSWRWVDFDQIHSVKFLSEAMKGWNELCPMDRFTEGCLGVAVVAIAAIAAIAAVVGAIAAPVAAPALVDAAPPAALVVLDRSATFQTTEAPFDATPEDAASVFSAFLASPHRQRS